MRYLILSDIHGNFEALTAVLKHARGRYDRMVCLGDLVGYGAEPNEVVEWAREVSGDGSNPEGNPDAAKLIRGNHDKACCGLDSYEDYNDAAQISTIWTAETLSQSNLQFLHDLPQGPLAMNGGPPFDLVHGSPADEDEYIITNSDASHAKSSLRCPVTFFGHTHLQGGFFFRRATVKSIDKVPKKWHELTIAIDEQSSFLLNPGSVGQPRDNDWRAAYAIYEAADRLVTYYRVEYDAQEARRRVKEAGLPPILGDRLLLGK